MSVYGFNEDKSQADLLNIVYPVGCIIESTTCSTQALVKATYGGTTWIQHTGYMLRGASSGVSANSASATGGADSITPAGTNSGGTVGSHTLTASEIPAHTHGSVSLTGQIYGNIEMARGYSTQTSFFGGANGIASVGTTTTQYRYTTASGVGSGTGNNYVTIDASHTHTSVGGSGGHSHGFTQPTFTGTAHTNLPKYKSVYIWERTA